MNEDIDAEIVVRPIKRIVIFESLELSLDEFFKRMGLIARTGQLLALNWAEEVVFFYMPFAPESEAVIEDAMDGTVYWGSVVFASMPRYEPLRKIGGMEIPIIDQTPDPHLKKVARYLKEKVAGHAEPNVS